LHFLFRFIRVCFFRRTPIKINKQPKTVSGKLLAIRIQVQGAMRSEDFMHKEERQKLVS
jgi:hypothetical protein